MELYKIGMSLIMVKVRKGQLCLKNAVEEA